MPNKAGHSAAPRAKMPDKTADFARRRVSGSIGILVVEFARMAKNVERMPGAFVGRG
jgi:hypothetical protein